MAKPLQIVSGLPTEVPANATSAGATDAGKLVQLNGDGYLDPTLFPTGIGADVKIIEASETIASGDFVTIFDDAGTPKVRLADASDGAVGQAHGFVLDGVASGADASVYFEGANPQVTGLTAGTTYVLSHTTPGKLVALASGTTTAGHILQLLGVATEATEINVEIEKPIVRG